MVSKKIIENKEFLKKLARTKTPSIKEQLLVNATTAEILSIVEICYNLLKFKIPLTPSQKRKLAVHANFIRKLSRTRSEKSARKILQKGGGPVLAALLVPVLAEIAKTVYNKLTN